MSYKYKRHSEEEKYYKKPKYEKYKDNSETESKDKTEYDVFNKYKHELNKLLNHKEQVIRDFDDFWTFLNKYEGAEKKMQSQNASTSKGNFTILK